MFRGSKYFALVATIFKVMLSYRAAFILMGFGALVRAMMLYYFWKSVYGSTLQIEGMDFTAMVTYIIVAQVVAGLAGIFFIEGSMASAIREGTIAVELAYPMNYQVRKLFEAFGFIGLNGLITGGIVLIAGFLFLGVAAPPSLTAGIMFPVSVLLGLVVEASMGFCMAMAAFFTTNIYGTVMSRKMITDFFSGAFIPLAFFPRPLYLLAKALPFQATVHIPVSIYIGAIQGRAILYNVGLQLFWAVAAFGTGSLVWKRTVRYLEVQGG